MGITKTSGRAMARPLLVATLAAVLGASSMAWADGPAPIPPTLEQARARFAEGLDMERRGRWQDALDRFQAALQVKPTAAVLFHVGLCEENLGARADALTHFEAAALRADADNAADVSRALSPHLDALRAVLGRVTFTAPAEARATILLDGKSVPPGTIIAVEPGKHRALLSPSMGEPQILDFEIAAGEAQTHALERPKPKALPPPSAPRPAPPPRAEGPGEGMRLAGIVAAGAGALALGGSAVMFAMKGGALDDVRAACEGRLTGCPSSARRDFDRGRTYNTVGNVLLGVGGLGLGAGVALFLGGTVLRDGDKPAPSAGKSSPAARAPRAEIIASAPASEVGLSLRRAF